MGGGFLLKHIFFLRNFCLLFWLCHFMITRSPNHQVRAKEERAERLRREKENSAEKVKNLTGGRGDDRNFC